VSQAPRRNPNGYRPQGTLQLGIPFQPAHHLGSIEPPTDPCGWLSAFERCPPNRMIHVSDASIKNGSSPLLLGSGQARSKMRRLVTRTFSNHSQTAPLRRPSHKVQRLDSNIPEVGFSVFTTDKQSFRLVKTEFEVERVPMSVRTKKRTRPVMRPKRGNQLRPVPSRVKSTLLSPTPAPSGTAPPFSVFGLSWVGIRTDDLERLCAFFQDVMGMHFVHHCAGDHAIYRMDNGDFVALYGPSTKRYETFSTGPVIGFRVGNIVSARASMEARSITFLGPTTVRDEGRWKYAHFRGPDKRIYELVEESPWADGSAGRTSELERAK
jgi:catechol 2,3-dioxygenase-like lactoylglutathione lyase family enzyme